MAGFAINHWAHLDALIFRIFHQICGSKIEISRVLYYRQNEIGSRIRLVDSIAKVSLDGTDLETWKHLKGSLDTKLRNILAHSPINVVTTILNASDTETKKALDVSHKMRAQYDENDLAAGRQSRQRYVEHNELVDYIKLIKKWEAELRDFAEHLEKQQ